MNATRPEHRPRATPGDFLDQAPHAFLVLDLGARVVDANSAARALCGRADCEGLRLERLVDDSSRLALGAQMRQVVRQGEHTWSMRVAGGETGPRGVSVTARFLPEFGWFALVLREVAEQQRWHGLLDLLDDQVTELELAAAGRPVGAARHA